MSEFRQIDHSYQHEGVEQQRAPVRPANYEILAVTRLPGRSVVVVLVHVGRPFVGQMLGVMDSRSKARWIVSGISFAPHEALAAARWGILLRSAGRAPELRPQMHLLAA